MESHPNSEYKQIPVRTSTGYFSYMLLSGKSLDVKELYPNQAIPIFIEEDDETVVGCITYWFGHMFEPNVQVALGAEVQGHDLAGKLHPVLGFNLGEDLLQVEL